MQYIFIKREKKLLKSLETTHPLVQSNTQRQKKKVWGFSLKPQRDSSPLNLLSVLTIPSGGCCKFCRCLAVPMATTRWADRLEKRAEGMWLPYTCSDRAHTQITGGELPPFPKLASTQCGHRNATCCRSESRRADDQSDSSSVCRSLCRTLPVTHTCTQYCAVHKKRRRLPWRRADKKCRNC